MLTQTNGDRTFEIYSTDLLDLGMYEIIVRGTTETGKMAPNADFTEDLIIPLVVTNDCISDRIFVDRLYTISDFDYVIDADPINFFTPIW